MGFSSESFFASMTSPRKMVCVLVSISPMTRQTT